MASARARSPTQGGGGSSPSGTPRGGGPGDGRAPIPIALPFTELFVNSLPRNLAVKLAKVITGVVNLEPFLLSPVVLFMLGLDSYASICAVTMLVLSSVSQVPKRFSFRARPYMVSRARGFTKDPTTSFPSRAVTCGMVYSSIFFFCLSSPSVEVGEAMENWRWWYPLMIVLATVMSAWARVFLGAHYPSDCIFSLPQGLLILTAVGLMFYFEKFLCGSCSSTAAPGVSCYRPETDPPFDP